YHPEYKAFDYKELSKGVNERQYYEIVKYAEKLGFFNGFTQEHVPADYDLFRPDFNKNEVFKYYEDK
ncbi:MAG: hypothetical protein JW997_04810, partial [Actinobacteria bacterium]|nr:hypothetical protein [Actinomycetota bacterium]